MSDHIPSDRDNASMIIFAPDGIGEVDPDTALAEIIVQAVAAHAQGPLRSGDILVVTSKIISKLEDRRVAATDRQDAITAESVRTVAQRGETRIVETRHGLTMAAAGVDNSNVHPGHVLLLPVDPDASAAGLRAEIGRLTGVDVGVLISDTAGRAWRTGQTDLAIGAAGVRLIDAYAGQVDAYGNDLHVTAIAIADELAGAADLVKSKLAGRPVAVIRGAERFVTLEPEPATSLIRPSAEDMFRHGSREAVVLALLTALGRGDRYDELIALPVDRQVETLLADPALADAEPALRDLVAGILRATLAGSTR